MEPISPTASSTPSRNRFSLLLLSHGELYFEDFSVFYFPPASTEDESIRRCGAVRAVPQAPADTVTVLRTHTSRKMRGRLKLCSHSLVFDPQDITYPIVKLPFESITRLCEWRGPVTSRFESIGNILLVETDVVIEMCANNAVGPYLFRKARTAPGVRPRCAVLACPAHAGAQQHVPFRFALNYERISRALPRVLKLYEIASRPVPERAIEIARIEAERESSITFDTNWLVDFYEQIAASAIGASRRAGAGGHRGHQQLTPRVRGRVHSRPRDAAGIEPRPDRADVRTPVLPAVQQR